MRELILFGATGYSGQELLRLLAWHPQVQVVAASASTAAGELVSARVPELQSELRFSSHDDTLRQARAGQVALLATPAKNSLELAPALLERGLSVVDLSGAFRLPDAAAYPEWYGFTHPRPELLAQASYGLVELVDLPAPRPVLVANPGCYATAAILAAAPALAAGLVEPGRPLVVDGKSGTTGAGRTLEEKLLFSEVAESLRPYRVGKHQHTPEMERALSQVAGRPVRLSFSAHLVPMRRGLLASVYVPLAPGVGPAAVEEAYRDFARRSPFLRWLPDRPPETGACTGNNFTELHAAVDPRTGVLTAFAALDNLVKGAAGQAIQNVNRVLGLPVEAGLLPARGGGS